MPFLLLKRLSCQNLYKIPPSCVCMPTHSTTNATDQTPNKWNPKSAAKRTEHSRLRAFSNLALVETTDISSLTAYAGLGLVVPSLCNPLTLTPFTPFVRLFAKGPLACLIFLNSASNFLRSSCSACYIAESAQHHNPKRRTQTNKRKQKRNSPSEPVPPQPSAPSSSS